MASSTLRLSAAAAAATLLLPFGATGAVAATADPADDAQSPAGSADAAAAGKKVQLLSFTDFHGRIGEGIGASMASVIERERAAHQDTPTAVLSVGDNIGASTYASSSQNDDPTLEYLNTLGVNSSAVGNHEFDKGAADVADRVSKRAEFPLLGANVHKKGTQQVADGMKPYAVIDVGGVKIGVIGVVTKETASLVSPEGIKDVSFDDPVAAANKAAQDMEKLPVNEKPDMTVLTGHLGPAGVSDSLQETKDSGAEFKKVVDGVDPSVDAMYFGHTHLKMNFTEKIPGTDRTRPIMQAESYGTTVGQSMLESKGNGDWSVAAGGDKLLDTKGQNFDSPVVTRAKDIISKAEATAKEKGAKVVGTVTDDIARAKDDKGAENRGAESTLGSLVADALKDGTEGTQLKKADIGITNPGGLRADLLVKDRFADEKDGEVTVGELNKVLPFANQFGVVPLKGKDVMGLFSEQWQPEGSARPFLHLGISKNVRVVYDSSADDPKKRVRSVQIDGKDIDPEQTYRVATLSFLAAGGDSFSSFTRGNYEDSGKTDFDVWQSYFEKHKSISPDKRERQADAAADMMEKKELRYTVEQSKKGSTAFELTIDADKDVPGPLRFSVTPPKGMVIDVPGSPGVSAKGNDVVLAKVTKGTTKVTFDLKPDAAKADKADSAKADAGKAATGKAQGLAATAVQAAQAAPAARAAAATQQFTVALTSDRDHDWWDNDPLPLVHSASVTATDLPGSDTPSDDPADQPGDEPGDDSDTPGDQPGDQPGDDSGSNDTGSNDNNGSDNNGSDNNGSNDNGSDNNGAGDNSTSDDNAAGDGNGNGPLPRTGAQIAGLTLAALLLLLVGAAAVVLTRARSND